MERHDEKDGGRQYNSYQLNGSLSWGSNLTRDPWDKGKLVSAPSSDSPIALSHRKHAFLFRAV